MTNQQAALIQRLRVRLCGKAVVANNFASMDPDVSTRGTVGRWVDVCLDGLR